MVAQVAFLLSKPERDLLRQVQTFFYRWLLRLLRMKKQPLISRTAARRLVLTRLEAVRPALVEKMSRVSEQTFLYLEQEIRRIVDRELARIPSTGKTIVFTQ